MRRNCNTAMGDRFQTDMQEYLYDLRALVRFVSLGFEEDIPASILPEIPTPTVRIRVHACRTSRTYGLR